MMRTIVLTHGDPREILACGRPVVAVERDGPTAYLCPEHGTLVGLVWKSPLDQLGGLKPIVNA